MGLLHDAGLAEFYTHDIHALNALLDAMSQLGMPVDAHKRLMLAHALQTKRTEALSELQRLIPLECCPKKVYKKRPVGFDGVVTEITATAQVPYCTACNARRPNKKHKCQAPVELRDTLQTHYEVRLPFVPSSKGLLAYLKHRGYQIPEKYDRTTAQKRPTTDEAALLRLALRHEEDPIFAVVLRYRDYDKQLSTYVGRPGGKPSMQPVERDVNGVEITGP